MSNPKNVVYVMSTGGVGDNVTGSGTILNCHVNGEVYNIGIDCGISQGKFEERNKMYHINGKSMKAFIITHAHSDHMGAVATLKDFNGKIYGTKEALTLGLEILRSGAIQNIRESAEGVGFTLEQYMYLRNYLKGMIERGTISDERTELEELINDINDNTLYNLEDVERIKDCFFYVDPLEVFQIADGINVKLIQNSHQLGAISAEIYVGELDTEECVSLSFSGDIGPSDSLLYKNFDYGINSDIKYAWMESTHGVEERSQSVYKAYLELKNRVFKAIKRKGTLVLATFATDRSAKLAYMINRMIDETNMSVSIYWDTPLGYRQLKHYQAMYHDGKSLWFAQLGKRPFDDSEFIICDTRDEHIDALRDDDPKVIITASAFGEGGRIHDYFEKYIQDENAEFLFAGWLSPDCTSNKVFSAERGELIEIEVNGVVQHFVKFCKTTQILGLTSHGYYPEFVEYINRFPNLKCLVLNHGDREAKEKLAEKIKEDYNSSFDIFIPELFDSERENASFFKLDSNSLTAITSNEGFKIFEKVFKD